MSARRTVRERYPMPPEVEQRLLSESLMDAYAKRPPYQRNDYLGWIRRAKRPETREKRVQQMLTELRDGHVYMRMRYKK